MPLAWVDEISGLEPAINFLQGNGYTSKLWPYDGVEERFLAYLPLQGWLHICTQYILGFSIYTVRLPYAIYLLVGALFLYKTLQHYSVHTLTSLVIVVLVLNEKSLFETTRGIRIEPITFMLLSLCAYALSIKRYGFLAFSSSLLIVLHPYVWPVAGVFLLTAFYHKNTRFTNALVRLLKPNILWLFPIAVLLFYLLFIRFDIELLYSQFISQSARHTTFGGIGTQLHNHFVRRFWPYYITQPYIPLIVYFAMGYAIRKVVRRNFNPACIALILTHIVWLVILGPMHRYDSVLVFLSFLSLVPFLAQIKLPQKKYFVLGSVLIVLGLSTLDIVTRQTMAVAQRSERDPAKFLSWLNENIDSEPSLISGHEIAYYASAYNSQLDFFLFNTTPYRYEFEDYRNLYLLSEEIMPNHTVIGQYQVPNTVEWEWLKNSGTHTYQHLYLLKANSVDDYNSALKKMKSANTTERSKYTYQ